MTCFLFVTIAFLLGIWVGMGWFAHIVRRQIAEIEEHKKQEKVLRDQYASLSTAADALVERTKLIVGRLS